MNRRLYDLATRIAIYVERSKVQQTIQFNATLKELSKILKAAFANLKYSSLDQMTKAQLNALIADLRSSQTRIFGGAAADMLAQLRSFMEADLFVNKMVYASDWQQENNPDADEIETEDDANELLLGMLASNAKPLYGIAAITDSPDRLWATVSNSPIPANGLYLAAFVKGFTASAQVSIENYIRKAYANNQTVQETIEGLIGESVQGTSSQLERIRVQGSAVVHTAQAHTAAIAAAAVASAIYGRYMWVSVMDNRTSDICRSRNHRIYRYGEGPLPPAHIRCRSGTTPLSNVSDIPEETLYTWLLMQPEEVQDDLLGDDAEALRNGEINSRNFNEAALLKPMTFEEYRRAVQRILTR